MLPPPGFIKPLWRGWEGAGGVRSDLAVAVATIEQSLGGCHREEVRREETHCPSSNQHLYVRQVPHRSEVVPSTPSMRESKGISIISCNLQHASIYHYLKILEFLKSEHMRIGMSMKFVAQCNAYTRQKAGGQNPPPRVPRVIAELMSCVICVSRGTCLGKSCLGDKGKLHIFIISIL